MGVFARSWEITKLSFRVIRQDKELLVFPLLAGIFSLIFMAALLVPTIVTAVLSRAGPVVFGPLEYLLVFLVYLGLSFIATFFNVCVVYTAKTRFAGGNATFGESIAFAVKKIHLILMWSLLSATVGLILHILDRMAQKAKGIGGIVLSILTRLLGMAWSIITIFVIPGMVYHDLGPIDAIKRSVKTLKKTWGESLIRHFGLGLVQMLFLIPGLVIGLLLYVIFSATGAIAFLVAIGFFVIYFIILALIFGVANTVFNTALYEYADRGHVPGGYDKSTMAGAFKPKKQGILHGIVR